jgi:hypothetical protein
MSGLMNRTMSYREMAMRVELGIGLNEELPELGKTETRPNQGLQCPPVEIVPPSDVDAVEIGNLYRKGGASMIDSVRYRIKAGHRLIAKRDSLNRGEWLPWLQANAEMLGFGVSAANKLMKAASKFVAGYEFDEATALQASRQIWGHGSGQPKKLIYPYCQSMTEKW